MPQKLDVARAAVAELLKVHADTVVFEPNATNAVNTILRNLVWDDDGTDEILYFNSVYGANGKTIDYLVDTHIGKLASREITITYPCEDEEIVAVFKAAVQQSRAEGKRPKICLYDAVSSLPGVRFPFEELTKACREEGIISLLDGAQGIGMIEFDIGALDPDFFLTNCHKWLHVPRGCAVLYVPLRNQHLITSTTPTSHGYVPKTRQRFNPLPKSDKSAFVANFDFTGTTDRSTFLCVPSAIAWRRDVLGGEERIMEYTQTLAQEGGKKAAEVLGTEVLENRSGSMTKCSMTNVALPLKFVATATARGGGGTAGVSGGSGDQELEIPVEDVADAQEWIMRVLISDYNTYVVVYTYNNRFWVRISAQVYLDIGDFEWAGQILLELSKRVAKGDYKK